MPLVMIVDDDPDLRRLVEMKLHMHGIQTVAAAGGLEALELLQTTPVDCVVLDVMMPGVDGIETCRRIRADLGLTALPVVMLTARARGQDIEAGMAAGASDYVVKPFSPRELLARVTAWMQDAA